MRNKTTFAERFWSKVNKTESCWLWTGGKTKPGYGAISRDSRVVLAHRASYEMHVGPIPERMVVDHTCFNRSCVNPEHLRLATIKQNIENRSGLSENNTSGVRGVYWCGRRQRWHARVVHHHVTHTVGYFADLAEAEAAVIAKRNELFTHNILDRIEVAA